MKTYFVHAILLLALPFTTAAQQTIARADGSTLTYYLDNANAQKLLVVFQGSDCNSVRHNQAVKTLHNNLAPDAALLTIEKYALTAELSYHANERDDCPETYLQHDTMQQRIDDALTVLRTLTDNYESITLAGGSEGASMALAVAAELNRVDAVLALNAGSAQFQHDIEYSMQQSLPAETLTAAVKGFREFAQQLRESEQAFEMVMSNHGYAYWKDMLGRDLLAPLNAINGPVLLMQASADQSVDPKQARADVEAYLTDGTSHITFVTLEGLDHGFRDAEGHQHLERVITQAAVLINREQTKTVGD